VIPNPGTTADNILDNTSDYKALPWLKGFVTSLSLYRCRFNPRPVHVGFVVDKVSLVPHFSPSTSVLSASFHQYSILIHSLTINMTLATDSDVKHNTYKKQQVSEAQNNNACVLFACTTSLL
jgi:hypothetical protein